MKQARSEVSTAIKAMLAIVVIVFITEVLIMYALGYMGFEHGINFILLDGILLALICAPPIYWLVLN
ncbi:MAG TPA: hypothetical protein VJ417_07955, partial [Candidatus Glassbacteria bacterium]|nr:hypothetical protein [Candidatus Glassbacteria bacterium]